MNSYQQGYAYAKAAHAKYGDDWKDNDEHLRDCEYQMYASPHVTNTDAWYEGYYHYLVCNSNHHYHR